MCDPYTNYCTSARLPCCLWLRRRCRHPWKSPGKTAPKTVLATSTRPARGLGTCLQIPRRRWRTHQMHPSTESHGDESRSNNSFPDPIPPSWPNGSGNSRGSTAKYAILGTSWNVRTAALNLWRPMTESTTHLTSIVTLTQICPCVTIFLHVWLKSPEMIQTVTDSWTLLLTEQWPWSFCHHCTGCANHRLPRQGTMLRSTCTFRKASKSQRPQRRWKWKTRRERSTSIQPTSEMMGTKDKHASSFSTKKHRLLY